MKTIDSLSKVSQVQQPNEIKPNGIQFNKIQANATQFSTVSANIVSLQCDTTNKKQQYAEV